MHQRQCLAHEGVAQPGEPSGLFRRQSLEIPPYHLNEHQLAQSCQNALAPGVLKGRFPCREADELADPAFLASLLFSVHDQSRQVLKQRIERPGIAGEKAADKFGRGRPFGPIVDDERQLAAPRFVERVLRLRIGTHAGAAGQDMRVAVGEDDDFAGFNKNWLSPNDSGEALASGDHVEGDQVFGAL